MTILGLLVVVGTLGGTFGIPAPIITVIQVILVVVIILYLLQFVGLGLPGVRLR